MQQTNNPVIYLNGVALSLTESSTPAGTRNSDAANSLYIGNTAGINRTWDGYIMDVKIYKNVAVTATNVAKMASKINVDKSAPDMPSSIRLWWKGTASTGTDSSGEGNNLTASNLGSVVYDAFSVNVQDNSTTTDGTFTVTQGKVEGLSLTSPHFDGDNDFIELGSQSGDLRLSGSNGAVCVWFKADDANEGDGHKRIFSKSNGGSGAEGYDLTFDTGGTNGQINSYTGGSQRISEAQPTGGFVNGKWYHVVWTWDGTNHYLYLDGVLLQTVSSSATPPSNTTGARIGSWNHSTGREFDGNIRDVRIYDYGFSADQAASLYSGSYNVTPLHWWKLDDALSGTSVTTAVDSGTSSSLQNGTLTNFGATTMAIDDSSSTWNSKTLDLDGTLTIAANGTLSAPRGNLDLEANLDINCTTVADQWIHNGGKVRIVGSGSHITLYPNNATFFNIDLAKGSGHDVKLKEDITILGTLDLTGAHDYWILDANGASGNVTMTMGDASNQATIDSDGADKLRFIPHATREMTITGHSAIQPCLVEGADWMWDYAEAGAPVKLAYMNFDPDIVTHSSGSHLAKITLTGDCEFDAVTVSSGDTLDLNGKRMVTSGTLSLADGSNFDASGGSFAYCNNFDNATTGTITTDDNSFLILTGAGVGSDWQTNSKAPFRNVVINSSGTITANGNQDLDSDMKKVIIGAGTLSTTGSNYDVNASDMTIATGGILTANGSDITVAGDFTTSGGLIGKSALNLTGSEEVTGSDNLDEVATTNKFTVEAWFKASTDANHRGIFSRGTGWNAGNIYLYQNSDGNILASANDINSGTTLTSTTSGLADGKWHHAVTTYDTVTWKLYVDGKLEASAASTDGINTQTDGFKIGDRSGNNFVGNIGRVSVWKSALSETLIRKMMFMDWTTMAADSDFTDSDAIGWWQFDEGTSTAVEDLSSQSNDGTLNSAAWAGAGTFTEGTSTLKMTGTSKKINTKGNEGVYNLTISGTTSLTELTGGYNFSVNNNLTVDASKTLSSTTSEVLKITNGASATVTLNNTAGLAGLYALRTTHSSGTLSLPELTTPRIILGTSGGTTQATGNHTITTELELASGTTFNANGNTIATKMLDVNGGTIDLSNSILNFSVTSSGENMNLDSSSTLLSGNTTVSGFSKANKTPTYLPAAGNFEIVGDVSFLEMTTDSDLTVIGTVTDCSFGTGANIRQWHHTLDTQQLLDADEAGDDDVKLPKPSLDNAHELQLGG